MFGVFHFNFPFAQLPSQKNHRQVEQEELPPRVQSRIPQLLSLRPSGMAELSPPPCEFSIRVLLLQLVANLLVPELCHLTLSPEGEGRQLTVDRGQA